MGRGPGVAVVGCGQWGRNHVRVLAELGVLAAVCDPDVTVLEAMRSRHPEVEAYPDLHPVLARPDISGLVIATPAQTHAELALRALRAGKDILVEKPMALGVEEGRRLVDAARELERVLLVGHTLDYHPAARRLGELVHAGTLGRLRYLWSNRLSLGRIRTQENALWSFAPHDVALMLGLVGSLPEELSCHGGAYLTEGVADVILTSLTFPGEIRAHIFCSWLQPEKERRLVVVGERQMAVFDDTRPWAGKLVLYPHEVSTRSGGPEGVPTVVEKADPVPVALEAAEPLRLECEEFLECILSRRTPLSDGGKGLAVLQVLEAAQQSLEERGRPRRLERRSAAGVFVHPSATIDPDAEVGPGSRVWHFTHVMEGARIGVGCVLGQNVFVGRGARIGDGVRIQNNVSVYEGVELEDGVFCGPSVVFTNVLRPRSHIDRKAELERTVVRRGATLGANSTIVCGATIGPYGFVAAGAVVTRDVPAYALVCGVPARLAGWVCECGTRLSWSSDVSTCSECSRRYQRAAPDRVEPA